MKNHKIKSYCKINLYLRVIKKLNSGYHNIISLITFSKLHDLISVSTIKEKRDKIIFYGKFKNGINRNSNSISKVLNLLRKENLIKKYRFKIKIKKNIPIGAGLGGGSSNAAALLNYLNNKFKLNLNNKKIKKFAEEVGSDVPIALEKKNTLLTGKKSQMLRLKQKFKLNLLIVYPNIFSSTQKIYRINKKKSSIKPQIFFKAKSNKSLIIFLKKQSNDLENAVVKIYPKIGKVIEYIKIQKGCYYSRITGSGSACIGIFSNLNDAIYAKKRIKMKYPNYWCVVSKTI